MFKRAYVFGKLTYLRVKLLGLSIYIFSILEDSTNCVDLYFYQQCINVIFVGALYLYIFCHFHLNNFKVVGTILLMYF